MIRYLTILFCGSLALAGCEKETPPRSVNEFEENPMLLEAAMVRCGQDRAKSRYDAECINARLAVGRIQAREEAAQKAALEASSKRKREELRRRQEAVAEARRRAAEAEQRRKEAEYLAQFGIGPGADGDASAQPADSAGQPVDNRPGAEAAAPVVTDSEAAAPVAPESEAAPQGSDLEAVREELRRRNEQPGG